MKREPKKLSVSDYDDLALELAESNYPKAVLGDFKHPYILTNRKFYPMLLDALGRLKTDQDVSHIIELVNSQNDYVETDLPDWVINNRDLTDNYLDDFQHINHSGNWQKFQDYVIKFSGELPENMVSSFWYWCKAKLEVNFALHKKVCTNPLNCPINQGYERRIAFVQSIIEQQKLIAPPMAQSDKKAVVQIEWLGTQKELAELFIELKRKGWISDFIADTIKECFTKSNSIQQVLKPHHDKKSKTKEPTYEGVYTPEYGAKFYGIVKNKNPKTD